MHYALHENEEEEEGEEEEEEEEEEERLDGEIMSYFYMTTGSLPC